MTVVVIIAAAVIAFGLGLTVAQICSDRWERSVFERGRSVGYDQGYRLGEAAGYNRAHDEVRAAAPGFAGIPWADMRLANELARRRRGHAPTDA